jgi:DNA-binding MarR family transcriptional regulator
VTRVATNPRRQPEHRGEADLGIVDALAQLSFLVHGMLARHAAAHDLSMIQTRLLGVLRDRDPTMQELARLLELDKSSVTGLVDRAEKRGLVRRTRSAEDGRSIIVNLTSSGRKIIGEVGKSFQADIASATSSLSFAEKKRLSAIATRIVGEYATRL